PAPVVGIGGMRAWSAVVPAGTQFLPVGGIDADTLGPWLEAGAQGAAIGSQLYAPGSTPHQVRQVATELVGVWQAHRPCDGRSPRLSPAPTPQPCSSTSGLAMSRGLRPWITSAIASAARRLTSE